VNGKARQIATGERRFEVLGFFSTHLYCVTTGIRTRVNIKSDSEVTKRSASYICKLNERHRNKGHRDMLTVYASCNGE
jgi:hypothetical protein